MQGTPLPEIEQWLLDALIEETMQLLEREGVAIDRQKLEELAPDLIAGYMEDWHDIRVSALQSQGEDVDEDYEWLVTAGNLFENNLDVMCRELAKDAKSAMRAEASGSSGG